MERFILVVMLLIIDQFGQQCVDDLVCGFYLTITMVVVHG